MKAGRQQTAAETDSRAQTGNCAETDSRVEKVAQALLSRALGCTVTETRTEWSDKGGEKTVTTVKEMPPDISAQMFWLKNRCPEQWRDKPPEPESQLQHPDNNLFEKLLEAVEQEHS